MMPSLELRILDGKRQSAVDLARNTAKKAARMTGMQTIIDTTDDVYVTRRNRSGGTDERYYQLTDANAGIPSRVPTPPKAGGMMDQLDMFAGDWRPFDPKRPPAGLFDKMQRKHGSQWWRPCLTR